MGAPRRPPPHIPGYTYLRGIGGGGFADVYLYRQHRPSREVAIKVLRVDEVPEGMLGAFDREADLMASVSNHPYIVTIFGADQAEGRPYLVMEYYPKPNYAQRARGGLDASAVLQLGIQLAGAIETAHRAGVVHRDIKPANVLVSSLDSPGLTDFGIAGSRTGSSVEESVGMSIPYTAPEVIDRSAPGDEVSDVYSLAATLYTLVARRTPFEIIGGENSTVELAKRVLRGTPPSTGAAIPDALEDLLAAGLSHSRSYRPQSAREFGLGLQGIEAKLGYRRTDLIISSPSIHTWDRPDDDDDGTRATPIQIVDPDLAPRPGPGIGRPIVPAARTDGPVDAVSVPTGKVQRDAARVGGVGSIPGIGAPPIPGRKVETPPPAYDDAGAFEASPEADNGPQPVPSTPRLRKTRDRTRRLIAASVVVGLIAIGAVGVAGLLDGDTDKQDAVPSQNDVIEPDPGKILGNPEVPTDLAVSTRGNQVIASWKGKPEVEAYVVARYDPRGFVLGTITVSTTEAVLEASPGGGLCVEVQAAIGTLRSAPTPRRCL